MGLLDNESIPRRQMTLFFMIDKSGSMDGSKIGSVNDAIENVLPIIGEISDENPTLKSASLLWSSLPTLAGSMMSRKRARTSFGRKSQPKV